MAKHAVVALAYNWHVTAPDEKPAHSLVPVQHCSYPFVFDILHDELCYPPDRLSSDWALSSQIGSRWISFEDTYT